MSVTDLGSLLLLFSLTFMFLACLKYALLNCLCLYFRKNGIVACK